MLLVGGAQSGDAKPVCASCHPSETKAFLESAMGKSIGPPDHVPPGKVIDSQSGSEIKSQWRDKSLVHSVSEDGLQAEYEIRYQIGAGKVGHSYAVAAGDYLLESPASFYTRFGWDVSPGFRGAELLDFNRVLGARCLFCHSNSANFFGARRIDGEPFTAISCERCHGPTDAHLQRPSSTNIVNPAKLPVRARDSICEQCHLEGAARILNPAKTLTDFKPGADLEATLSIYVGRQTQAAKAVSQEEQLALSRCARQSGGKLWCGSCHNPHSQAKNRAVELKAVCTSCHPVASLARHSNTAECQSCHMPSRAPTDVAHTALTDHRILATPAALASTSSAPQELRPWRDPRPELRERNLGLAYLAASADSGGGPFGEMGESLLKKLSASQRDDDPAALAALGDISLAQGHAADALPFFRRALELDSSSGEYALYLGIALKQNADLPGAGEQWKRAIHLDPSLQRAYLELSALYAKQNRFAEAKATLDEYLKWNSQSILVRLTKDALPDSKE